MKLAIIVSVALTMAVVLVDTSSDAAEMVEQQLEEVLSEVQNEKRESQGKQEPIDDGLQYDALEHGSSALSASQLFVSFPGYW